MEPVSKNSVNSAKSLRICPCCLAPENLNDIFEKYRSPTPKEDYLSLLKDTFNIQINVNEFPSDCLRVCDDCLQKILEATSFRTMVMRSLDNFANIMEQYLNNKSKVEDELMEEIKEEVFADCDDKYVDDINASDDDDEILANLKLDVKREEYKDDEPKRSRKKIANKRSRKKTENIKHAETSTNLKMEKDWQKIAERRGNGPLLRENSLKLIANSTLCIFQWHKSRYRCFCCKEPFSDMNSLREHTNISHTLENIEKKIIVQQNCLVKAEITSLFCKICGIETENLNSLRNHLKNHDIKFELDEDLLVPFKIDNNLKCQICFQSFTTFRLLNIHVNKHFQKQVCHICGAGFSNLVFLNLHKTRMHRPYTCKACDVTFKNKLEKKEHDISVHNLKMERKLRFPCPYCTERFFHENIRVQHLVEQHGLKKPEHKCTVCSKVFITRSLCNNHVRNVHLKEKNKECDVCHHVFYTKSDVARHKVTHTGEKKFSCSLCNNLFATKDSLRRHTKRTHVAGA